MSKTKKGKVLESKTIEQLEEECEQLTRSKSQLRFEIRRRKIAASLRDSAHALKNAVVSYESDSGPSFRDHELDTLCARISRDALNLNEILATRRTSDGDASGDPELAHVAAATS